MIESIMILEKLLLRTSFESGIAEGLNVSDVARRYEGYLEDFRLAVALFRGTVEVDDKVAMQCALTRVRVSALNISGLYQDLIDDVLLVNGQKTWPSIPEGYVLPARYSEFLPGG